jgi:hypothetical protein
MHARIVAVAAVALLAAPPLHSQTFDFESTPIGAPIPFDVTAGALTATFSSPDGNVYFVDGLPVFTTLTGQYLLDDDQGGQRLLVGFSRPLTSIALDFALGGAQGTASLAAFRGTTLVGSVSAPGVPQLVTDAPEGVLTFAGGPFDRVIIQSSGPSIAVDNIAVRQARVERTAPEPATLALMGSGLFALVGVRTLRRRT